MSGHSKWSQIKRQKAVTDSAKSKIFSRFARLITLEAKKANGVLTAPGLTSAIARAKAVSMPKDTIERAILKGASTDTNALEEVLYEAYGPGGVAIIVHALTDNKNRITPEIKHLLTKQGLLLGAQGSALWAFTKRDCSFVPNAPLVTLTQSDEEKIISLLEAFDAHEDVQNVFTNAYGYEDSGD